MNRGLPIAVLVLPVEDDGEEDWLWPLIGTYLEAMSIPALIPSRDKRRYMVRVYDVGNAVVQEFEVENRKEAARIRKEIYSRVERMTSDEIERHNANELWSHGR